MHVLLQETRVRQEGRAEGAPGQSFGSTHHLQKSKHTTRTSFVGNIAPPTTVRREMGLAKISFSVANKLHYALI